MIGRQLCVGNQWTVAHCKYALLSGILVIIFLSVRGSPGLSRFALICGAFKLHQHRIGGCPDRCGSLQDVEQRSVTLCQFLPQKIQLHLQIANALSSAQSKSKKILLSTPERPLSKAVASAVVNKILIDSSVYLSSVVCIRHSQFLFISVLEIGRFQTALGIEISHQAGHSAVREAFLLEETPNGCFRHEYHPLECVLFLRAAFSARFCAKISFWLIFFCGPFFALHTLISVMSRFKCHFWHSKGI